MRIFLDLTNKSESATRHRADEPLLCAGITDGPASGAYAAAECIVRHGPAIPHHADELFLAHDAVPVPHQMNQHVEHLRLDAHSGAVPMELTPSEVCGMSTLGAATAHVRIVERITTGAMMRAIEGTI